MKGQRHAMGHPLRGHCNTHDRNRIHGDGQLPTSFDDVTEGKGEI
jgi:hypothetical protein